MKGRIPKPAHLRRRKAKTPGAAMFTLPADQVGRGVRRELPARGPDERPWHPETLAFWDEVWQSPVAAEYLGVDVAGLILLATLVDRVNYGELSFAPEVRLQRQCFGLSPIDRRRLQWECRRAAEPDEARPAPASTPSPRDPRKRLDPKSNVLPMRRRADGDEPA